ncbi:hypothetical protein F01_570111 [Burkholderia cenocepacia]|nr:hypothetical protein F01_570111 [Burkholderia cenocepacia]
MENLRGITTLVAPNFSQSAPCLRSSFLFRFFPVLNGSTLAYRFCFSRPSLVPRKSCKSRLCLNQANASMERNPRSCWLRCRSRRLLKNR